MNPTIYDIAKVANVSKSTVSRVLNNHPSISEKAKKRVLDAIAELNYQPSKIARGLSGSFDAVLVISRSTKTTMNNPYFSEILHVISKHAEEENYDVILQTSQHSEEELTKCIAKIKAKMIKGIIMLSSPADEEVFRTLDEYNIPIVVIGKVEGDYTNIYSIDTNNYQDSYHLIQYLIDLGHKDIACLYSPQEYHVSVDRLEGYKTCMTDNGVPLRNEWMVNAGFTVEEAYQSAKLLFQREQPSAVFATDDLKIMGLYKALDEYQASISKTIQIVGYSNSDQSSFLFPSFVQIKNPTGELGKVATEHLFSIIKENKSLAKSILVSTEMTGNGHGTR